MFFRKYWIPLLVFIIAIVGVSLYYLQNRPSKDPIVIVKPVEFEKQPVEAPVGDTSQDEHRHTDGTWHEGPHDAPVEKPSTVQVQASVTVDRPFLRMTYEEYEKWATAKWNAIERNEYGIPIQDVPNMLAGIEFPTIEDHIKASNLHNQFMENESKIQHEAMKRLNARYHKKPTEDNK